jgi:molecular chaperone GrpE (heat shock protein)
VQADLALTQRTLDEARVLSREGAAQGTIESRLPVLRQVIALADEIHRALGAGQGDADSLGWVREQLIDILASYNVNAVGAPGEHTRFDPAL